MELFKSYEKLFEEQMDVFLQENTISAHAFYQHCQTMQQVSPDSYLNVEMILSGLDYTSFATMMNHLAIHQQRAGKALDEMGF